MEWSTPFPEREQPQLHVYNSLTKRKDKFVPKRGKHVQWYNCGPTVYDASHMGHARNYVSQDVLRRILTDYFGYDVHFVQNVTDIDDKARISLQHYCFRAALFTTFQIIIRARQNHLLDLFRSANKSLTSPLLSQVNDSFKLYIRSNIIPYLSDADKTFVSEGTEEEGWKVISEKFQDQTWRKECLARQEKFEMYYTSADRAFRAMKVAEKLLSTDEASENDARSLIDEAKDVMVVSLDEQYKSTVSDPAISRSLASYWEEQFSKDMARLNVRPPDTITRVTEFIPEIIAYVGKIIQNGYAYAAQGSVYFNTAAFDQAEKHTYAKLEPGNKNNIELIDSGEGSLTGHAGQRRESDFALWKSSKPGEPWWPSPWGNGRPGWHIECSVMATAILGDNMDIHSGGIDLAFPHHDNEIAQAEAFHDSAPWVNYFLHTGHLHIGGLKMSKSLKNFITIDEILMKYTSRQLRLSFLTSQWSSNVDFSEALMSGEVRTIETLFNNFFANIKALVFQVRSERVGPDGRHHYEDQERVLVNHIRGAQHSFHVALCDSFNTPEALSVLRDLVSKVNVYMNSRSNHDLNLSVVEMAARWITKMLRMFGLDGDHDDGSELGWMMGSQTAGEINREAILMPYLQVLSSFRDGVRDLAIRKEDSALKDILSLCDRLRDGDLVPLGVALDDQESGKALVKLVPPEDLVRARDEKRSQAEAKAAKKSAAVDAERQKRMQKLMKGKVAPEEMFKPPNVLEGSFGSWNEKGIPLTDGDGNELSKNQAKKVQKDWSVQAKLHAEYLSWEEEQKKVA